MMMMMMIMKVMMMMMVMMMIMMMMVMHSKCEHLTVKRKAEIVKKNCAKSLTIIYTKMKDVRK